MNRLIDENITSINAEIHTQDPTTTPTATTTPTTTTETSTLKARPSKNINRHPKNGRFHAKTQNNGKHFNGTQGKSKQQSGSGYSAADRT